MRGGRGRRGSLAKRGRGRGRGRGRSREADDARSDDERSDDESSSDREADERSHESSDETWITPRCVSSSMLPRRLTRHSKGATLGECATSNPPLRGPIRGIPISTPRQHSPQEEDVVVQHAAAAASASNFSSILHKNTVFVPTNFSDHRPNKKDCVGKSVTAAGSTNCSAQAPSFNVTEFVLKQREEDSPEVESDPALVCVNGLKVKNTIAALLGRIFQKHGDITAGTDIKSSTFLSSCLERVCAICQRLEHATLDRVTLQELSNMCDEVEDLEHQKLSLGWLRKKLESIRRTKAACTPDEYLAVKEEVAENEACMGVQRDKLERYRRECADLQEKMRAAEDELRAAETKFDRSKEKYLEMRATIASLKDQSLAHGLL